MEDDAQLLEFSSSKGLSQEEGFYYKEADDDEEEAAGREGPEKERRIEIHCEKDRAIITLIFWANRFRAENGRCAKPGPEDMPFHVQARFDECIVLKKAPEKFSPFSGVSGRWDGMLMHMTWIQAFLASSCTCECNTCLHVEYNYIIFFFEANTIRILCNFPPREATTSTM